MTSIQPNLRINIPASSTSQAPLHALPTPTVSTQADAISIVAKPSIEKLGSVSCLGVSHPTSTCSSNDAGQISPELEEALQGINWGSADAGQLGDKMKTALKEIDWSAAIEAAAEGVSTAPDSLQEKVIEITQPTARQWNTNNIGAFVQAVLRESYMLQSEQLLDFANKVKHCNLQKKGLREHLAKLRELKTTIGPLTEEEAVHTTLNGTFKDNSATNSTPTSSASLPALDESSQIEVNATIANITSHKSSSGQTSLEERMMSTPGYRKAVIEAIPHMNTQELWHLVHALGGEDFHVADKLSNVWQDIVDAMTPEQLVEMCATRATAATIDACDGEPTNFFDIARLLGESSSLLHDCSELSRVAANRYQTIRDFAAAELDAYNIDASVGSPESLLIALEELEIYKSNQADLVSAETASQNTNDVTVTGYIESVTVTDLGPELVATGETVNTVAELDDEITKLEDLLNSVGEDAQMANLDLQNALQKQQQLLQMMSNMSKTMHETAMSIIRKIGS